MSYANLLFAPCIIVEFIATCFKWNKRNKRIEQEGRLGGGIDPADSNDPEYRAWHEKHFGEGRKENAPDSDNVQKTNANAEKETEEETVTKQPTPLEQMTAKKSDQSDPAAKPSMHDV